MRPRAGSSSGRALAARAATPLWLEGPHPCGTSGRAFAASGRPPGESSAASLWHTATTFKAVYQPYFGKHLNSSFFSPNLAFSRLFFLGMTIAPTLLFCL